MIKQVMCFIITFIKSRFDLACFDNLTIYNLCLTQINIQLLLECFLSFNSDVILKHLILRYVVLLILMIVGLQFAVDVNECKQSFCGLESHPIRDIG